ncbi:uncharacterized protein TNCT_588161 [Trichonephila clavata]|uniref:Uncharacterized protein n=1 Tax=Trichonephila clavata TaxID=2740835 RepID=A0A8X6IVT7_TRICU|nr:uncharacterized protein TNCT_588161 [Trichonephila clavata]
MGVVSRCKTHEVKRVTYTSQKAKSKSKDRIRLENASQEQSNGTNKTPYYRVKQRGERKRINVAERISISNGDSTPAAGAVEIMRVDDEIASILTPDYAGIGYIRSSFMKRLGNS